MTAHRPTRFSKRATLSTIAAAGALLIASIAAYAATNADPAKVRRTRSVFVAKGELTRSLRPGVKSQVKISLANNKRSAIWVKSLRISLTIDEAHAAAGCSVARDYRVTQPPRKSLPFRLKAARAVRLKRIRGRKQQTRRIRWQTLRTKKTSDVATVEMLNLPDVNQDACKGATLNLKFTGKATNKKPASRKARL